MWRSDDLDTIGWDDASAAYTLDEGGGKMALDATSVRLSPGNSDFFRAPFDLDGEILARVRAIGVTLQGDIASSDSLGCFPLRRS